MNKETRNLIMFFILTFVATWATYFTIVFNGWNPDTMPGMVFFWIGTSAPAWVAILMVLFTYNKDKRRDYFRRCFSFKQIKLPYWAFIVLVFPVIFVIVILLDTLMGGALPGMTEPERLHRRSLDYPPGAIHEFPLRSGGGIRLARLFARSTYQAARRTARFSHSRFHLGHLAFAVVLHATNLAREMGFKFAGFWTFMIYCIGMTMMMTWVYLKTNRSILSAIMMHYFNDYHL